ncbi:peptidase inhibitor 16-like [Bufo bufo]|uniref:peptidase inhibitor 16-like n=1 Tax=Bufo bufo TaxID=8384 RepID=UPI001ABDF64B|nr:peptidase inhibitor 16-like [Bufo bufo]
MQGPQYMLLCLVHLITALTDEEKKTIVEKHNFYRARAEPPAADMKALRWDQTLEDLAKSYAAKCIWDHNEERGFRGENLFIMSGSSLDVELGLADWHRERDYYNFTTEACQEGQMCGHYTQMVWGNSERVGCGENFCEKLEGFDETNMFLLVCNYEPPGNFQGEKPYTPGAFCSSCPSSHVCRESLCADESLEQEETSTAQLGTTLSEFPSDTTHSQPYPEPTQSELDLEPTKPELDPKIISQLFLEPTQSELVPEHTQSELDLEPTQPELDSKTISQLFLEPKNSELVPEPIQSELDLEPTQPEPDPKTISQLFLESTQSELVPEHTQSELDLEPTQPEPDPKTISQLFLESTQSELVPEHTQSELDLEPTQPEPDPKTISQLFLESTQSELVPEHTQSELDLEPTQPKLDSKTTKSELVPEPAQSDMVPEPTKPEMDQKATKSELVPEPTQAELNLESELKLTPSEMVQDLMSTRTTTEPLEIITTQRVEKSSPDVIEETSVQPTSQVIAFPDQEYLSVSVRPSLPVTATPHIDKTAIEKVFFNDEPDTPTEKQRIPVTVKVTTTQPVKTHDMSVLVDKPQEKIVDTVTSQDQARRKDQQSPKAPSEKKKQKQKNMNVTSNKWKTQLSSSMRRDYKSGLAVQTYFGRPVQSWHLARAPRPCLYPCPRSKSQLVFPLYRTNHISSLGGYDEQSQKISKSLVKPSFQQLWRQLGYKRGVYSLYLPPAQQH